MASRHRAPGAHDGPGRRTGRQERANPPASTRPDQTPPGDLYGYVHQLVTDAGLYDPDGPGLTVTAVGEKVVLGWSPAVPVPATGTRTAIRAALLELLTGAGLSAYYRQQPGARAGTITVSREGDASLSEDEQRAGPQHTE